MWNFCIVFEISGVWMKKTEEISVFKNQKVLSFQFFSEKFPLKNLGGKTNIFHFLCGVVFWFGLVLGWEVGIYLTFSKGRA